MLTYMQHKWLSSYGFKNYENNNKIKDSIKKVKFHNKDEWGIVSESYIRSFIIVSESYIRSFIELA